MHSDCSAGAASWQVINLNGTASYGSAAYAVSGNSQVGWGNWAGSQRAAAWTGTADSGLQLASDGYAFGLGADGQDKAGYTGFFFTRAVLWRGEASILVNLQPEGALESNAAAAHAGTQVGAVDFGAGIHAATWHGTSGTFTDVNPSWAEVSGLLAIDASGQVGITVSRNDGSVPQHAALWHGSADSAVDLHPAGAYASRAQAISNGRQGGYVLYERDGTYYPAVWSGTAGSFVNFSGPGAPTDAGIIYGMDGDVQVGGARFLDGSGGATIWFGTPESAFNLGSLLSSDYTRSEARAVDIDEFGTIRVVGYSYNENYYLPNGTYYPRNEAMMWVLVPEPSSLVALAAGLAVLAGVRTRRR